MPTESEFLDWLYAQRAKSEHVVLGPGDDLAILQTQANDLLLVGIDQVLDGIHFDSRHHDPRAVGRKVMNRNLSDCAAMACLPFAAVVSAALPRGADMDYPKMLYAGLRDAGDAFGCAVVGGDTSAWDGKLAMSLAILGRSAGVEPVRRSGAKPGDRIYVTGALGGSILGRHMTFAPRVTLARDLAQAHRITAMIDLSDGLSRDLHRICQASHVSAELDARLIPIHADARTLSQRDGRTALDHALNDGEDHELLFTSADPIDRGDCIQIGRIIASTNLSMRLRIDGQLRDLAPGGWNVQW